MTSFQKVVRILFDKSAIICLLIKSDDEKIQKFIRARNLLRKRFNGWLWYKNISGSNIYLSVYPYKNFGKRREDPDDLPRYEEKISLPSSSFDNKPQTFRVKGVCDYGHFLAKAPQKTTGEPDYSVADISYCIHLFSAGLDGESIKGRLLSESPEILRRKKGGG